MLTGPALMTFAYLVIGLGTTIVAWSSMPDEIEMAIGMDTEDEDQLPLMRSLVTAMFVLIWPVLLVEVIRKR